MFGSDGALGVFNDHRRIVSHALRGQQFVDQRRSGRGINGLVRVQGAGDGAA